ncbi:MAG: nucleotidyltransferase family protein [Oscillospiraceae bacterium]|nr:nucleotidyltransferase family protein [Oscillospiraceae bacterium]
MNQTQAIFLTLLREAIHGQAPVDPVLSPAQWEDVFHLAEAHGLLPMILDHAGGLSSCCSGFTRKTAEAGAPEPPLLRWQERAIQQVTNQIIRENVFLNLILRLRAEGVEPLVMKGPVCRALYPKPWLRPSVDDDFLVPETSMARCHAVLKELGFSPCRDEAELESQWEISYLKHEASQYVELHKYLFDPDAPFFSDFNQAFERAWDCSDSIMIQDVPIQSFAPADHLLFLILHAFKHFLFSGFGIRIVADICLFTEHYEEQIDFTVLEQSCRALRCSSFAAAVYQIGARELGIPAPEPFSGIQVDLEPLFEDVLASGVHGGKFERLHSANITLGTLEANLAGKKSGVRLGRALFPSADALAAGYPFVKKHPILLPVAWTRRVVSYLFAARKHGMNRPVSEPIKLGRERVKLLKTYGVIS